MSGCSRMSLEPQRSASRGQTFRPNRQDRLIFVSIDPNDARSEAGLGIRLDVGVRPCRVDSRQDGIHRHRRIPFLDLREHHSARGVAGEHLRLGGCPFTDGRAKLGATDERSLRFRQIDENEVTRGERIAVRLVGIDAPQLDPYGRSGLFAERSPLRCVLFEKLNR
jgi:hypothetical protein